MVNGLLIDDKNYVILIKKGIFGSSFYSYNSMEVSLYISTKKCKTESRRMKIKSKGIQDI